MIEYINNTINETLHHKNFLATYITDCDIHDYMHDKDFGFDLATEYIEDNLDELAKEYLDEIFEGIDTTELHTPW